MGEYCIKKLLRAKDISEIIGCSMPFAYSIMHSKTFPSIQIGKNYYVTPDNLQKRIDRNAYKKVTL